MVVRNTSDYPPAATSSKLREGVAVPAKRPASHERDDLCTVAPFASCARRYASKHDACGVRVGRRIGEPARNEAPLSRHGGNRVRRQPSGRWKAPRIERAHLRQCTDKRIYERDVDMWLGEVEAKRGKRCQLWRVCQIVTHRGLCTGARHTRTESHELGGNEDVTGAHAII